VCEEEQLLRTLVIILAGLALIVFGFPVLCFIAGCLGVNLNDRDD
jgi:hypothetical protein